MTDDAIETLLREGEAALDAGAFREAAERFGALSLRLPDDLAVARSEANAWRLADDTVAARRALQRASRMASTADVATVYEIGAALLDTGAPDEALACFSRVARERPKDAAALSALAGALRASGDPKGAWPVAQRALGLAPTMPAVLLAAAQIRHALGDLSGALQWLDRADAIRPNHGPTQMQRGITSLLGGASRTGWQGFEHRGLPVSTTGARPWFGESLEGASIAVLAEQGIGDQFHFVRFVPRLFARGATRVIVECHPGAVSLFRASGFDAVPKGAAGPTDWYVPMLSLPHRLDTGGDTASEYVPYLKASPDAPAGGGSSDRSSRRLGLVLLGNPAFLATALRDFDLALLPALLDIEGVDWVWLQYPEMAPLSHPRLSTPQLSSSWLDTAQILSSLDGIVSVDTSMAHLGGAMGIPTYVLLPYTPDWRWGLRSRQTPWYPTARLIRQPKPRDWRSVVHALTEELAND
jgi:tetratricopeptide (TPR) repeat protein